MIRVMLVSCGDNRISPMVKSKAKSLTEAGINVETIGVTGNSFGSANVDILSIKINALLKKYRLSWMRLGSHP